MENATFHSVCTNQMSGNVMGTEEAFKLTEIGSVLLPSIAMSGEEQYCMDKCHWVKVCGASECDHGCY